jgi:hypothetical protein
MNQQATAAVIYLYMEQNKTVNWWILLLGLDLFWLVISTGKIMTHLGLTPRKLHPLQ